MTVDELKQFLEITTDGELAEAFQRGVSSVSNWRAQGAIPNNIELKARKLKESIGVLNGSHNQVNIASIHMQPETQLIQDMMRHWDDHKRKRLLRFALELDEG